VTESSYVTRVAALLGADPGRLAARLVARLWDGPRPGFPELLDLALNPARVQDWLGPVDPDAPAMGTAPAAVRTTAGTAPDRLPGGRCPLCQCASAELRRPEPGPAAAIHREYPAIDPALGVCERCLDRVLLVPTLGGMS
jgi:hypothetical protein